MFVFPKSLKSCKTCKLITLKLYLLGTLMPTLVSVTGSTLHILSKIHAMTFSVSRILVNSRIKILQIKIVINPELIMILTWNLGHFLNLGRKTWWRQKSLIGCQAKKLGHRVFFNLQPGARFRMYGPWYLICH